MNTFRGDLQLATLDNLDSIDRLVAAACRGVLDLLYDIIALEDFAEDDVTTVEPAEPVLASTVLPKVLYLRYLRGDDSRDEELGAVGVLAGVGHGQQTGLGVLELEVLILELVTVDCEPWSDLFIVVYSAPITTY